jgi:nucleoside-diphosphate-sugar epimerase
MKTAFVTGGTGFIGAELCRQLVDSGYRVKALCRPGSESRLVRSPLLTPVIGDIAEPDSYRAALSGCQVVFHLAALYREAKFGDAEYWRVNFDGTAGLLAAAREAAVDYFSYCSTTGVLGHIANPPGDESTPYGPLDVYQESKTEAEKLVMSWLTTGQIKGSVIRPTMVWGPGDTRLFKLFRGVATRKMPIIGSGQTLCHWVLVSDLVRAFILAAETDKSIGELYIVGGDRPVTLEYTMQQIANAYGVSLFPFKIPVLPIQLIGSLVERVCVPFGIEPPIHRRRVDFFVKNRAFRCEKARQHLGYQPSHTMEEETRLTAAWYLDNGWLTYQNGSYIPHVSK